MLDKKYDLHKLDLGAKDLTLILDKLILETSCTDLREKIPRVYSKELESLEEEKDKRDLITTILKWYLSEEAYIESVGMRLMVDGYIEGYNKTRNIKKGGI